MTQKSKREINEIMDSDLHELFLDELADLLNAEKLLAKALPIMAEAAISDELISALEGQIEETEDQIKRLEQVFASLDEPIQSKECQAMKGLIDEGQELMEESKSSSALDAAIISAAQKVKHYEIASYGTVSVWAAKMGHYEAANLLNATLEEEKATDEMLTDIADSTGNEIYDNLVVNLSAPRWRSEVPLRTKRLIKFGR